MVDVLWKLIMFLQGKEPKIICHGTSFTDAISKTFSRYLLSNLESWED